MKIVLSLLIVLSMSLMGTGCAKAQSLPSNSLYLEVCINQCGGVSQSFGFPTYEKELLSQYSREEVDKYKSDLKREIEVNVYNNYYLKYFMNYIQNPIEGYEIGGELVSFVPPSYEGGRIVMEFNFLDSIAWRIYNNKGNEGKEEGVSNDSSSWVIKEQTSKEFPFNCKDSEGRYYGEYYSNVIKQTLTNCFPDYQFEKGIEFEYRYITPYKKVKSNADIRDTATEGYVHSWSLNEENFSQDKIISIWINQANKGIWYLTSLIVFLGISTLLFSCVYLKNKKKLEKSK